MSRRYLVTGGAGFIGSHFIRHLAEHEPDAHVTDLDALSHTGVSATVEELNRLDTHTFVHGSIADAGLLDEVVPECDVIVNFAAESHVDRSISAPLEFMEVNGLGTAVLLEAARRYGVARFIHVSTDEVYGSMETGAATEAAPLRPSSPYAASKAAADLLVHAYAVTYGYRGIITRCTNNFGPYQYPEKLLPLFITRLLEGRPVPLYGDGNQERDWLWVGDHCAALHLLVEAGQPGEIYNIGADAQLPNARVAEMVIAELGLDDSLIQHVEDRPGHDRRYAVDSSKVRALGWAPTGGLGERLTETVDWYRRRRDWWEPLPTGDR